MEQEFEFFDPAPQNVRRQLLFQTPLKRKTAPSQKDTEIQNTPKAKTSKPKITTNRPAKKVLIDFGVQSNYFLNEPTSSVEKSKEEEEEDSIFANESQIGVFGLAKSPGDWYFESPMMTARKPKNTSSEGLNDYTKEPKQKKAGEDSPFCKLLNESDKYSVKTYQTLDSINEQDEEEDEILREKYAEEIRTLEKFFKCFADRSLNILSFFVAEPVFEVIGEEKVYPLNTTLNALAKAFLRFECCRGRVDYEYKVGYNSDGTEVILTTSGRLIAEEAQPEFVLSAKILIKERLINHAKLKIM